MRLFVALNIPSDERERLWSATQLLRESQLPVRWVTQDAVHLTLKFLGEVTPALAASVTAAAAEVASRHQPVRVRLSGAGAFPSIRRPAVWWIGVAPNAPLGALQADVERTIAPLGFPTEARPFSPHLTLGRTVRGASHGALAGADALLQGVAVDRTITVETLDLMRSHLSPRGARYERVSAAPLQP